jgi:outer membrane lipoprotein SlyB
MQFASLLGMAHILAGTYDAASKADAALRALLAAGVPRDCVTTFHNNPPGQHGTYPIGGDEDADPVSRGVGKRAAGGAAIGAGIGAGVGAAIGGPLGAAAGGGVGAFTGALAGTYTGLAEKADQDPREHLRRPAGTVVAVTPAAGLSEETLVRILKANEPVVLEETEGEWQDGEWKDFDPLAVPRLR